MNETILHTGSMGGVDVLNNPFPPTTSQDILNNLQVAILILDDREGLVLCNHAFTSLFKIHRQQSFLIGLNWHELTALMNFDTDSGAFNTDIILQLMNNKKTEVKVPAIFYNDLNLSIQYTFTTTAEGQTFHQFNFIDNSLQVKQENELATQKQLFANILHHLPSDIAVLSNKFEYVFVNPAAIKSSEIRRWIIGKTDEDYCRVQQKDLALAKNRVSIYKKALATQLPVEWEEEIINRKGEKEYHLRKMKPVITPKGEVELLIGYGMNISERKNIEDRIQISEKRYRDLFNYCKAIICTHDLSGNFLTVNPALCEAIGYTDEEMTSKNLRDVLPQDSVHALYDNYLVHFENGPKAKGVFKVVKKDSSCLYLLYENFRVDEPNKPSYVIGFAHDITDRIKAESELRAAKKLTEETALMKERFLANMSHEIRTPMNGILGMANLLQKTVLTSEQQQFLRIINNSAQNLLTIINDILDIEKIAAGEVKIERIPFDIVHKTTTTLHMFEYACKEKGIELIFDNHLGAGLTIIGDPTRYIQIINNLVSNAVKFTSVGTISIKACVLQQIDDNITLQFSVIDTGIGMEENKLEQIFEPFTQAYAETTRKYGGTGLGLAITKNLLELQGGTISVKSKLGYGSKFTFTINYKKSGETQMAEVEPERPRPIKHQLGALKVLLAEDNEVNQLLARSILMYWGLETRIATTGNEVMALVEKEDFDVILMDIQMPEKSGLEAAAEIRTLADNVKSNIPIIALTANALKGEEKKYIAVGMDDFLTKPFKEKELLEVITRVLANKGSFGRTVPHKVVNQLTTTQVDDTFNEEDGRLYDMNSLNEVSRGNKDFLVTLAKIFLSTIPKNSSEMVEAAEIKNWDKVSSLAHKLKSTIDTMNIKSIKQDIRAIEINARNKAELPVVCRQVQKVNAVIEKTAVQLKEQFSL